MKSTAFFWGENHWKPVRLKRYKMRKFFLNHRKAYKPRDLKLNWKASNSWRVWTCTCNGGELEHFKVIKKVLQFQPLQSLLNGPNTKLLFKYKSSFLFFVSCFTKGLITEALRLSNLLQLHWSHPERALQLNISCNTSANQQHTCNEEENEMLQATFFSFFLVLALGDFPLSTITFSLSYN